MSCSRSHHSSIRPCPTFPSWNPAPGRYYPLRRTVACHRRGIAFREQPLLTGPTPPPEMPLPGDQTPLYNSGILRNYIQYLQAHHPDVNVEELLRCTGLTRFDINDEGHFLTQEQINRFHGCLDERLADDRIPYKVGRHALGMKSTGTLRQYGLQFLTPGAMYKAVDRLYPKWAKAHSCKTVLTGKGRAEVTVSVRPGIHEQRFQCENRRGIFETIGEVFTGQPARLTHPECIHLGDEVCRYLISWREKPSAGWKRTGAYGALTAVFVAVGTYFFITPASWALLALTMSVVCLSIRLYGSRLEIKELAGHLKEQGDSADRLLKEIETRYHNARLIQEIGLAGADILEVNTFLKTVLESMARNLNFTRGLVVLLNEEHQRLCYVDSYGFSAETQPYLKTMDYGVDLDHSSDVFIRALKTGRPVLLDKMSKKTIDMAPNSLEIIERLGVDSLIGVPLIHKKNPLGLLLVGTRDAEKEHTTSDVNLLAGIASQIATGIVNARSFSRIQESEQRYRLLAENVADVIWILDFETFKMQYVSPSIQSVLGYTPEEIMGTAIDQYLTVESFEKSATALGEAMERATAGGIDPKHHSVTLEVSAYRKNRTVVPLEVTAGFLVDENDRPNAILGISRDLSERKKADKERAEIQSRLQRANKMESLGTMAGSIAHNFNNLLMVVLGNLELAKETLTEGSATARNIQRAVNATQRAADLSGMMLTYVGQLKKESVPVDLSQMVNAVLKNMDESTMTNVTLDLDLADPMPLVAADAGQMRQMISGFITNAIEALGRNEGRVRISTGWMQCNAEYLSTAYLKEDPPEGMYTYVEVADTGCGMDTETMGKVFDPFFSTKFTGRGLGMAAVMGIIRSHKGVIKVSSSKNQGSVFTALFPIHRAAIDRSAPAADRTAASAAGRTVLIVDDEEMVMDIGRQFLERIGYTVREAASGRDALVIFEQAADQIDCVLLDFTMPGLDGLDTMKQIKAIRSDAKIIITSGYTRQQIEDRFIPIGPPDDFIQKPFEMRTLREKLDEVMSKPR